MEPDCCNNVKLSLSVYTTITRTINKMSLTALVILAYYGLVALMLRLDGSYSFTDSATIAYVVSLIIGEWERR